MAFNHRESEEAFQEFKDAFNEVDLEGRGKLTLAELGSFLSNLQYPQIEVKSMLDMIDADVDGNVDIPEILMMLAKKLGGEDDIEEKVNQAFKIYDRDSNGEIAEDDLRRVMLNLSDKLTLEEREEMIREADDDGNGTIDYEEFVKMLITS